MTRTAWRLGAVAVGLLAASATAVLARGRVGPLERGDDAGLLGAQRRLSLRFQVDLAQPERPAPLSVELDGDWVTTVVAVRPGERDVACQVEGVQVSGAGVAAAAPSDVEALAALLGQRFWVTYRLDGSPLRVHFPRSLPPSGRNLLEMLVTEAQLVRPPGDRPEWTAVERDGAGAYLALYGWERREPDGAGILLKRKVRYLAPDESPGTASGLQVEVTGSERRFELDRQGEVIGLVGGDALRIEMPMGSLAPAAGDGHLEVHSALRLERPRQARDPAQIGSLERARGDVESGPIATQAGRAEEAVILRDQRLLQGQTTETLLAAASAKAPGDPKLAARLAALFRRNPETIGRFLALVRAGRGRPQVTDGLALAAVQPAIAGLGGLARDVGLTRSARIDALNALVRLQQPGDEALRIPNDLLDDPDPEVRRAARMVLGALAHAVRQSDPDAQRRVERALVDRLDRSPAPERAALLEGLGNSGGPETLAAAERVLTDAAAPSQVRVVAARALRRLEDPRADRRLASLIGADPDVRVRDAAVATAARRWPERSTVTPPRGPDDPLVTSLLAAATRDPAEPVRREAVAALRGHLDAAPEIGAALAEVARHDASPALRRLAREALGPGPAGR
jgi:hypothetical protein